MWACVFCVFVAFMCVDFSIKYVRMHVCVYVCVCICVCFYACTLQEFHVLTFCMDELRIMLIKARDLSLSADPKPI